MPETVLLLAGWPPRVRLPGRRASRQTGRQADGQTSDGPTTSDEWRNEGASVRRKDSIVKRMESLILFDLLSPSVHGSMASSMDG